MGIKETVQLVKDGQDFIAAIPAAEMRTTSEEMQLSATRALALMAEALRILKDLGEKHTTTSKRQLEELKQTRMANDLFTAADNSGADSLDPYELSRTAGAMGQNFHAAHNLSYSMDNALGDAATSLKLAEIRFDEFARSTGHNLDRAKENETLQATVAQQAGDYIARLEG